MQQEVWIRTLGVPTTKTRLLVSGNDVFSFFNYLFYSINLKNLTYKEINFNHYETRIAF